MSGVSQRTCVVAGMKKSSIDVSTCSTGLEGVEGKLVEIIVLLGLN